MSTARREPSAVLAPTAAKIARRNTAAIAMALLLAFAPVAAAGQVYRWTDANGVVHYDGNRPDLPASRLTLIPFQAEPNAPARLRIERDDGGGGYVAIADNLLAGPVQVRVHAAAGAGVVGVPELPARATVPARGSVLVARIGVADPGKSGRFELRMDTMPGPPDARPLDVEYAFPLQLPTPRVAQGWGGVFSHNDVENHHAVDFAADIGTPVLAARAGTVMQVESDFDTASRNAERFGDRANFVRILHDDGTMAVYAHLKPEGVLVRAGQRVRREQPIGLSGNTGFSTGPHLHFVLQVNRGMRLTSIPFRMFSANGILRFGESGEGGD
ncbi:MAG: peptidoglycan DD-metalloendopeptidase family protein [Luteimonas sp.]